MLSGVTVVVRVAHVRLCHSRMLFVHAYPRETQEMVFDAHDRAFALFKGACRRGIYVSLCRKCHPMAGDDQSGGGGWSHIRPSRPGWIASPICADLICDRHSADTDART